jgi:Integrase core domain.
MEKFRIRHRFSSPYHPQSNGLVERFNRTLGDALAKICNSLHDWDLFIQPILFAYRTKKLAISKHTPFELVYGRTPTMISDQPSRDKQTMIDRLMDIIEKVPHLRQSAKKAIRDAQRKLAENYHVKAPKQFYVGEKVLYFDKAKAMQHHTKLEPKWKGPYSIYAILPKGAYRIADHTGVLRSHVNGDLLKKYHSRESWEPIVVINLIY